MLLTETEYVPAKEEPDEDEDGASDGEEEVEFVESRPVCNTLPVLRHRLRRSV